LLDKTSFTIYSLLLISYAFVLFRETRGDQHSERRHDKARLHAVSSPHSSDWLHALPLSGCGLCLAIHIAVGLRLGANMWASSVPRGASVDTRGLNGLSCRGGNGRSARHHNLNDLHGVASDRKLRKGKHSGVKRAARPAQNWWEATWRCHTTAVETRKVRHVGRHSERHTSQVLRARDA